jgi:hypothetical protein
MHYNLQEVEEGKLMYFEKMKRVPSPLIDDTILLVLLDFIESPLFTTPLEVISKVLSLYISWS